MTIHKGWEPLPGWPITRWHVGWRTFVDAYGERGTGVKHLCPDCTKACHTPHGITQWHRIETWAL